MREKYNFPSHQVLPDSDLSVSAVSVLQANVPLPTSKYSCHFSDYMCQPYLIVVCLFSCTDPDWLAKPSAAVDEQTK